MSKRKKNLEKVIQQCQKTLDRIEEELLKMEVLMDCQQNMKLIKNMVAHL